MANGSLDDWLHQDKRLAGPDQGQRQHLTLIQRLNIAIDVTSALDYLHLNCGTPLVHRDIKPSNILLDDEFVAHVSEFGLAKFIQEATQSLSSSQNNKYGMGRESSTYGDVYSYGILLLELFTGKRPTDDVFTNGRCIHTFAKMAIPERVMEIVDPKLEKEWRPAGLLVNSTQLETPSLGFDYSLKEMAHWISDQSLNSEVVPT
ncbi:putative LRR receptor-like serine/threonine-protein kinase [Sesamum alatum]|uniref:LRR receptor-like serine/threonine-protein kinase n=1 Tax=Sesamum alatum TaxID=300844 RepID=A0AAE2CHC9_9LAMI|nr:putative LRR receptor-like serine/threonine-protein kinase [Sesamum alatum]